MILSLSQQLRNNLLEPRRGKQICLFDSYILLKASIIVQCCKHNTDGSTELWSNPVTSQKHSDQGCNTSSPNTTKKIPQNWREMRRKHLPAEQAEVQQWGVVTARKKDGVFTYIYSQETKILNSGKYSHIQEGSIGKVVDTKCISKWDAKQRKYSPSFNTFFGRYCSLLGCALYRKIQHISYSMYSTKVCIMTFWSKKNMRKKQSETL